MRTEKCVCGGYIRAETLKASRQQVGIHNLTLPHLAWRNRQGIHTPDLIGVPPHDPRRHWPTAEEPRDVSEVEGASAKASGDTAA